MGIVLDGNDDEKPHETNAGFLFGVESSGLL